MILWFFASIFPYVKTASLKYYKLFGTGHNDSAVVYFSRKVYQTAEG